MDRRIIGVSVAYICFMSTFYYASNDITILPHKLLSLLIEGTLWNKTIIFEFHTLFIRHEISKTKYM